MFVPRSVRKARRAERKREYALYLESPEWKAKRAEILDALGDKCYECGREGGNQVHHLRYAKVWGEEEIADFRVLCRECHKAIHRIGRRGGKRRKKSKIGAKIAQNARRRKMLLAVARGNSDNAARKQAYKRLGICVA
jgi:5-methylcytosine-specific restriction endonuclease McrA